MRCPADNHSSEEERVICNLDEHLLRTHEERCQVWRFICRRCWDEMLDRRAVIREWFLE